MALSAPGIGSNLDVSSIVSQLMAVEQRPLALLDKREASFQARLSAYGTLKGALSAFQGAMQGLKSLAKFQAYTATAGDPTVLSATANSSAVAGSYTVAVSALAQAHVIQSGGLASDTAASSTGTLQIRVGAGALATVTIDSSNNSLRGLRDAINAAGVGATAAIVNDGSATPYRLVLTANASGAANTIQITNNLGAGELKDAIDARTQAQAALDAALTVNGVGVTSAANSVGGVISGVTVNLAKTGTTTLTVARDSAQVQSAVGAFVKAYNDINKAIATLTAYDPATRKAGLLQGDSAANSLQAQIRSTLTGTSTGLSGSFTLLSQVGVTFQADGSLGLDMARLTAALDANFNDVAGVFATRGKSNSALVAFFGSTSTTQPGAYDVDITAAATQGAATATSAPAPSTVIDGTNDGFAATIDGVSSGALVLAHGTYSASELATALQNAVDGSSALAQAGKAARVTLDGGKIKISSANYGSASTVTAPVGTASSALGFAGGESGTGTDVTGNFALNGVTISGTGSGQFLTAGAGTAGEGLKIQYLGSAAQVLAGTDAVVNFSEGYAARLDRLAASFLGESGALASRIHGIDSSIKDIGARREAISRRLVKVEANLRAQFTALDSLIARLTTTGNYLQQQLARLPTISST